MAHTHASTALTLMERDHNKLFSVCLMGCEQECVRRLLPSGCVFTDRQWRAWTLINGAKVRRVKQGEAVLNQPSEMRQKKKKRPRGKLFFFRAEECITHTYT